MELLLANSFPRVAIFFIAVPTPPITPENTAPSVPNLILFNTSLPGSYSSSEDVLCSLVGPPNKSPKVPTFSTSPTKIPSAAPAPKDAAAYFATLPFAFN